MIWRLIIRATGDRVSDGSGRVLYENLENLDRLLIETEYSSNPPLFRVATRSFGVAHIPPNRNQLADNKPDTTTMLPRGQVTPRSEGAQHSRAHGLYMAMVALPLHGLEALFLPGSEQRQCNHGHVKAMRSAVLCAPAAQSACKRSDQVGRSPAGRMLRSHVSSSSATCAGSRDNGFSVLHMAVIPSSATSVDHGAPSWSTSSCAFGFVHSGRVTVSAQA